MIIYGYILCYNESELIPYVMPYWERFVDKLYVYDNESTDNSVELLRQYPFVEIKTFKTKGTINDMIFMKLKNTIWKKARRKADWVIVSDLDEVVYNHDLRKTLAEFEKQNISYVPTEAYDVLTDGFPPTDRLVHEYTDKFWHHSYNDKVLVFNPNKIKKINYSPGAHQCKPVGEGICSPRPLLQFHLKYLDFDYVDRRYKEYAARLSKENIKNKHGIQYIKGAEAEFAQMTGLTNLQDILGRLY